MIKLAYFAGGCFWCTESIFQRIKGVIEVTPGYMGGHTKIPPTERFAMVILDIQKPSRYFMIMI